MNEVGTFLIFKVYIEGGAQISKRDYLLDKEYKSDILESIFHFNDEGVILKGEVRQCFKRLNRESGWAAKKGNTFEYEYWIKDHLDD